MAIAGPRSGGPFLSLIGNAGETTGALVAGEVHYFAPTGSTKYVSRATYITKVLISDAIHRQSNAVATMRMLK